MLPAALRFLITMIACAINERMQRKLDYSQEEGQHPAAAAIHHTKLVGSSTVTMDIFPTPGY